MRQIIERFTCDLPECKYAEDVFSVMGQNAPLPTNWIAVTIKGVDSGKIYHSLECAEKALSSRR